MDKLKVTMLPKPTLVKPKTDEELNQEQVKSILYGHDYESCTRLHGFAKLFNSIKFDDYWAILSDIYVSSDSLKQIHPLPELLFQFPDGDPRTMMNADELKLFDSKPDQFEIYRGMSEEEFHSNNYRFSWTLDRGIAEFFAYKYQRNFTKKGSGKVVSEIVKKSDCLGFLDDRGEKEIILKPKVFTIKDTSDFTSHLTNVIASMPKPMTFNELAN